MTVFRRDDEPNDADYDRGDRIATVIFMVFLAAVLVAMLAAAIWRAWA